MPPGLAELADLDILHLQANRLEGRLADALQGVRAKTVGAPRSAGGLATTSDARPESGGGGR